MARNQDETIKNNDPNLREKLQEKLDSYLNNYRLLIRERKASNVVGGLSVLDVDLKIKKCKNVINKTRRRIREVGKTSGITAKQTTKQTKTGLSKAEVIQNKKIDRAVESLSVFWNLGDDD